MVITEKKYATREYKANEVVWFRKTKEAYGGLSNMCSGYPLRINGHKILTSEAIYQACRFPNLPDVQQLIIEQKSPMTAKMKSKPHRIHTQNTFIGVNALGRLLMELRQKYMSESRYDLLVVEPLRISNFKLFGEDIQRVDERINFMDSLINRWGLTNYISIQQLKNIEEKSYNSSDRLNTKVQEPFFNFNKPQNIESTVKADNDEKTKKFVKEKIMLILKYGKPFSSKEIVKRVQVDWSTREMTSYLKKLDKVEVIKGTPLKFKINQPVKENTLF